MSSRHVRTLAALALTVVLATQAFAEKRPPPPRKVERAAKIAARKERPIERLEKMTPAQRQKALERLPPERRRNLERRLDQLDKLSPDEKARVARFRELPPERQQAVRQAVNQMTALPLDRQHALRDELRDMRGLPSQDREVRMNSPEFKRRFNGHERKVIQNLSDVVPE